MNLRFYALQDANYNVTALFDATTGQVVQRLAYDAYGKQTVLTVDWTVSSAAPLVLRGFQGGLMDQVTGNINFQQRDYNPTTMTWTTQDPLGFVDGMNLYQFVTTNPINLVDPKGLGSEQVFSVDGVGYSLQKVGEHDTFISQKEASALGITNLPADGSDIPLGQHVHGDNGTKYFPRHNIELDTKTGKYSTKSPKFRTKFVAQCNSTLSPKQKAKIGVMALALGALILNEATGTNAELVKDLHEKLTQFQSDVESGNGDAHNNAPIIAEDVQKLFGNEVVANWVLGQLLKIANQ